MKKPAHKYVSRRVRAANAAQTAQKKLSQAWEAFQAELAAANTATKWEQGHGKPSCYLTWWNECSACRDSSPKGYYGQGREPEWTYPLYQSLETLRYAREQIRISQVRGQIASVPLYYNNYSGDGWGIRNHKSADLRAVFVRGTPDEVIRSVERCSANWLGHTLLLKAGGSKTYMGGSWESDPSRYMGPEEVKYIVEVVSRYIIAMV